MSWLTIFGVFFASCWLTLIIMLVSGIYWVSHLTNHSFLLYLLIWRSSFLQRKPVLIGYWLLFSCLGIMVEALLILYAFLKNSTFNAGLVNNSMFLGLAMCKLANVVQRLWFNYFHIAVVECCFAYIIYEFYRTVKSDPCRCVEPEFRSHRETSLSYISGTTTTNTASMQPRCQKAPRDRYTPKCKLLQGNCPDSPYTCGPKTKSDN